MRKIFLISFIFLFHNVFSQDISKKYYDLISTDSIRQYLYILTADSLEGRETGQPGQKRAANYLASKYASWKLIATGTNKHSGISHFEPDSFYQDHTISLRNNKGRNLSVNGKNFLYGRDFIYLPPSADTSVFLSDVLFIGSKDNENIKNVILSDRYTSKNLIVYDRGEEGNEALDLIKVISEFPVFIKSLFIISSKENINSYFSEGFHGRVKPNFNVFFINDTIAESFFPEDKFEKINRKSNKRSKPIIKELKCEASVGMLHNDNELRGQNIAAFIPGSDLKLETIVISSHYDHLGKKDSVICYGADDNASGTSAVLEIARIFKQAQKDGNGPRRNILFLNVSGEEKGLLGSSWYVSNPSIPLDNFVANLNIDMIGRTDSIHDSTGVRNYIYIIGSDRLSTQLRKINEEENQKYTNLELDYKYDAPDDPNNFYRRSDHYNFAKHGIPVIFYFDGKHADYHKPSDTPDKIDYKLLTERAQLVFLTAWELANRPDRIVVDKK